MSNFTGEGVLSDKTQAEFFEKQVRPPDTSTMGGFQQCITPGCPSNCGMVSITGRPLTLERIADVAFKCGWRRIAPGRWLCPICNGVDKPPQREDDNNEF